MHKNSAWTRPDRGTLGTAGVTRKITIAAAAAMFIALPTACVYLPEPEPDDEGHASFARTVIPILLGRKPRGVDEVEVVADIATLHGRETAVAMLMRDPQFTKHWADVLVDLLRIQRERTGGIEVAQDSGCWGDPTRSSPDPAIAEWIRDHAPGDAGAPTPPWNMTDLLESAIALDDLSPLYRANLFTMSMRRAGGGINSKRAEIAAHLLETYLNRDISCLRCHNPTYSASNKTDSDGNLLWRRTWTIPGHAEKALFGNYYDATAAMSGIVPIMRGDVRQEEADGMGIQPWGMDASCVTDTTGLNPPNIGTVTHTGFKAVGAQSNPDAIFGSLDGTVNDKLSLWELEESLHQGILNLQDGYERISATPIPLTPEEQEFCDVHAIFADCTGCHSGIAPDGDMNLVVEDLTPVLINAATSTTGSSDLALRVVPSDTSLSELSRRVNGVVGVDPWVMPPGVGLGAGSITIDDWITNGALVIPSSSCVTSTDPDVDPDEAFAYLTATNLVDGIWMVVTGHRLTIDNRYPRSEEQRDALWHLTELIFLPNDWSLQAVLKTILASDWIGRRAPTISQLRTPYELPPVLDPWVQADPSEVTNPEPHEEANGQGELVDRHRVNTLLRNVAAALSWIEPRRFPGGGYPSPLDRDLGQYLSPGLPGFSGVNFQSLLALEAEIGLCEKTGHATGADDWIDALVAGVTAFNAENPGAPLNIGEVWSVLKDRMIQDPTIERELPSGLAEVDGALTEEQAVVALFNAGLGTSHDLSTPATALSAADLDGKLREACGVLVKTPEFMLTNVTPRGYSDNEMPDPPRLAVCLEGETCGYAANCVGWAGKLWGMGKLTACEDRSVRPTELVLPLSNDLIFQHVNWRFELLCPPGLCGFVERPRLGPCLRSESACAELEPIPPVPPELMVPLVPADGGGPFGRPPVDLHLPGMLVMKADGARVTATHGVRHRQVGQVGWQPLEAGARLRTGDQIHVPLTAALHIEHGNLAFGVDPLEHSEIKGVSAQLISVTGDDAIQVIDRYFTKPGTLSLSELIAAVESGTIESRAMTDEDWERAIEYGVRPGARHTPTPEEIAERNADFEALHVGAQNVAPVWKEPADPTADDERTGGVIGPLLLVLLVLVVTAAVLVRVRSRQGGT